MVTIEDIQRLHMERENTDRKISIGLTIIASLSSILAVVFIIAYIFSMISYFSSFTSNINYTSSIYTPSQYTGIIGILSLIGGVIVIGALFIILEIYVFHRWLDARNKHFNRSREFYKLLFEYMKDKVPDKYKDRLYELKGSIDTLYNLKRRDIGSVAWAIIVTIFSLGIFLLVHLTIDYYLHRRLEEEVAYKLNDFFTSMGLPKVEWREDYEEREVLLYALLSLLTIGLFQIYWFYVISKDQNEHFDTHSRFEERVINNLEKL